MCTSGSLQAHIKPILNFGLVSLENIRRGRSKSSSSYLCKWIILNYSHCKQCLDMLKKKISSRFRLALSYRFTNRWIGRADPELWPPGSPNVFISCTMGIIENSDHLHEEYWRLILLLPTRCPPTHLGRSGLSAWCVQGCHYYTTYWNVKRYLKHLITRSLSIKQNYNFVLSAVFI